MARLGREEPVVRLGTVAKVKVTQVKPKNTSTDDDLHFGMCGRDSRPRRRSLWGQKAQNWVLRLLNIIPAAADMM